MLSLSRTKIISLIAYFLLIGCGNESQFTKLDSAKSAQDEGTPNETDFQNSEPQTENHDPDLNNSNESLDWLAEIDLPDDQQNGSEVEGPIMITGAHLVSCTTTGGAITCVAQTDEGFDASNIEIFDLDGEPIPTERIQIEMVEEGNTAKVVITVVPAEEPAPSPQELCEMQEGYIWDADSNSCQEKVYTEEELCIANEGFYWSAADSLCIADGTEFGLSVSMIEVNTNLPLGAAPIDIEFNLTQTSYVKYVDIYTDWFAKRPTDIKVYHSVDGAKGELIAERNFPTRDDQICGEDFLSPCTFPEAPVSRLTVELDKLYYLDSVIVEVGGLLSEDQGFAIIMDAGLRN